LVTSLRTAPFRSSAIEFGTSLPSKSRRPYRLAPEVRMN
jgi:hypothetical protein